MTDVAERAHRNLCDFIRFHGRLDPASESLDEAGVVASAGSIDFPSARIAIRTDSSFAPEEWAEAAAAFFDARGKSSCVFVRAGADDDLDDVLTARNYQEWSQSP